MSSDVHPDLERIIAEDEIGRAAAAAAADQAQARAEAARREIAQARAERLRALEAQVVAAVAAIDAEADRDVSARRERRAKYEREISDASAASFDAGVDILIGILTAARRGGR